jgi:hypothetical protein
MFGEVTVDVEENKLNMFTKSTKKLKRNIYFYYLLYNKTNIFIVMSEDDCKNFNDFYYRPPNFCESCGEMLDFQIIVNNRVKCQKCEDEMPIVNENW